MVEKTLNYKMSKPYFKALKKYLSNGFVIEDSPFLSLKLRKCNDIINLNLLHEDIELLDVVYPNFDNTLINIMQGFRQNYGASTSYKIDSEIFDKKYDHTIMLILDGMGKNILDNFSNLYPNNFLSKHYLKTITSIYPSTTAASTTSIKTGLVPLETGWTGWQNWIRECNKNVVLFMGVDYYTYKGNYLKGYDILPFKMYYEDLNVNGDNIEPDFSNKNYTFKDTLNRGLDSINNGSKTLYMYDETPDRELHRLGTKDKSIYDRLYSYSKQIEEFYNALPNDTLFIISADHGHTDIVDIEFYNDVNICEMISRPFSNDTRCVTFKIKDEYKEKFEDYFNKVYGKVYKLYKSSDAIKLGFLGKTTKVSERIEDFLADFVAVSTSNVELCQHSGARGMKSAHAGITRREMEVPLIVLKK